MVLPLSSIWNNTCDCLSWWSGTKMYKTNKKLANHGLQYGYLTISVILTVLLDNVRSYSGTTTPSATIWIYKIGWSEKKNKSEVLQVFIHFKQIQTTWLGFTTEPSRISEGFQPSPGTIIVLEAKEARDHDLEKSGLPRGIWVKLQWTNDTSIIIKDSIIIYYVIIKVI